MQDREVPRVWEMPRRIAGAIAAARLGRAGETMRRPSRAREMRGADEHRGREPFPEGRGLRRLDAGAAAYRTVTETNLRALLRWISTAITFPLLASRAGT